MGQKAHRIARKTVGNAGLGWSANLQSALGGIDAPTFRRRHQRDSIASGARIAVRRRGGCTTSAISEVPLVAEVGFGIGQCEEARKACSRIRERRSNRGAGRIPNGKCIQAHFEVGIWGACNGKLELHGVRSKRVQIDDSAVPRGIFYDLCGRCNRLHGKPATTGIGRYYHGYKIAGGVFEDVRVEFNRSRVEGGHVIPRRQQGSGRRTGTRRGVEVFPRTPCARIGPRESA